MTNRIYDRNNFYMLEKNPIATYGIFDFAGSEIDQNGSMGLDPDSIYKVYRSKETLQNIIPSLKMVGIIDGHKHIGAKGIPAEQAEIGGSTGSNLFIDGETLYSDIKIFSGNLKELIENGKKELSIGYTSKIIPSKGEYKGQSYDYIQADMVGNHLAIVDTGRAGSTVRIGDSSVLQLQEVILFDEKPKFKEVKEMEEENKNTKVFSDEQTKELTKMIGDAVSNAMKSQEKPEKTEKPNVSGDNAPVPPANNENTVLQEILNKINTVEGNVNSIMGDQSSLANKVQIEIQQKEDLINKASTIIGNIDGLKNKSLNEVAISINDELKIGADSGEELIAVKAYLKGIEKVNNNQNNVNGDSTKNKESSKLDKNESNLNNDANVNGDSAQNTENNIFSFVNKNEGK